MKHGAAIFIICLMLAGAPVSCSKEAQAPGPSFSETQEKFDFPYQGRIVFQSNVDGDNEIYMLSRDGLEKLTDNNFEDRFPVWSPDRTRIAYYADPKGNDDIFIMDLDSETSVNITQSPGNETEPAWFPGGRSLAYTKETKKFLRKTAALYKIDLETRKTARIIPRFNRTHGISNVSPTEPLITFTGKRLMGWDVAVFNMKTRKLAFLEDKGESCRARFSKDGKKLAYVSSRADGKGDIWMMNPDGTGKRRLTIRDDTYDYFPSWSPDGRYIAFNSSRQHNHEGDWQLWVVEVQSGKCTLLFDSPGNDVFPDWR